MNIFLKIFNKKMDQYLDRVILRPRPSPGNLGEINIFIDPKNLNNFSESINRYISANLDKLGFIKLAIPSDLVKRMHDSLLKSISKRTFDNALIDAGYSIPVFELLKPKDVNICKKIGKFLCQQDSIKDYIFLPSVIDIQALFARYSPTAPKEPTHAFLWHRDGDCHLNQLKLMLPLVECSYENGMFSAISKQACPRTSSILDSALIERHKNLQDDDYLKSDSLYRLSDATAREYLSPTYFYDVKNSIGEAILINTNDCYHKGGHVTKEGQYRLLIQITLGSFIHTWHKDRLPFIKKIRQYATEYFASRLPAKGKDQITLGL